jgi:Leucine-rich repeat (LRR) protein
MIMAWPTSQDYNEAIQSPARNFIDPDLKCGQAVTNALGLPMPYSGNFADVYQLRCPGGARWAVKCFTRHVPGLRERYAAISRHLRAAKLPFMVDFAYLEQGIRVSDQWYPVLKMEWVEGLTLNQFIGQNADKPAKLQALLQIWARMEQYLRGAKVGHCDLQHGNVLLAPGSSANALALKLVDYDGMWVPPLAGSKSGEVGHPAYQHPRRVREETYSLDVDRFPLLLIATALQALQAGGGALWQKYDNGDNVLFTEADLQEPTKSYLFLDLLRSGDLQTVALAKQMIDAVRGGVGSAPLLETILGEAKALRGPRSANAKPVAVPAGSSGEPWGSREPRERHWYEDGAPPPVQVAEPDAEPNGPDDFDGAGSRESTPISTRRLRHKRSWQVAAGAVAVGIVVIVILLAVFRPGHEKTASGPSPTRSAPATGIDATHRDEKNTTPPSPADSGTFTLQITPSEPRLMQGGKIKIIVTAQRKEYDKRINVELTDLPDGITADKPRATLAAGNNELEFELSVARTAAVGDKEITVRGSALDDDNPAADSQPFTFSVAAATTFALEITPAQPRLKPDEKAKVNILLVRKGYDKKINVGFTALPPGVSATQVDSGPMSATWELSAAKTAPIGDYPVKALGKSDDPNDAIEVEHLFTLSIIAPPLREDDWTVVVEKLKTLNPGFDGKSKTMPSAGAAVTDLDFSDNNNLKDISPLRVLKTLRSLDCSHTQLDNLTPLKDMNSLEKLTLIGTKVSDLSPLRALPGLRSLDCTGTPVSDLAPLKEMKTLETLSLIDTKVADLTSLRGLPLKEINCDFDPKRDADVLLSITTLKKINGKDAKQILKGLKGKPATEAPAPKEDPWIKKVAAMSPNAQVTAVTDELIKLNSGFGDKLKSEHFKIKDDAVIELDVAGDSHLTNIQPLRALTKLRKLNCSFTQVSDLTPLTDLKLTELDCSHTPVADLSPLRGTNLTVLRCQETQVADLSPLERMKLTTLHCEKTKVSDLEPLKGMPLKLFSCENTVIKIHAELLHSMTTLERINNEEVKRFWKDLDGK